MAVIPLFRTAATTALLVIYSAVFLSVLLTSRLPSVPTNQGKFDFKKATIDLHHIAARPHPYNSHANDHVREYLLSRVLSIAAPHTHVHVSDDNVSNASWPSIAREDYFEGNNILVKIDGRDSAAPAVLFSAHFDSVSTAPGATDDGMGVASLLQLMQLLADHQPTRTAVFNINNGEEDGLCGAFAFLQHPWANITDTFLNLEGAASGGRPILFRATSAGLLQSFRTKYVPHPHANVLSADVFSRGFIRSATDYTVYTGQGNMQGLDVAFYKGRSKYHTRYDAIAYTEGQGRSLWAMMETSAGAGRSLLNDPQTHDQGKRGAAVYFDLFSAVLVVFRLSTLFTYNIVSLVVGPVALILVAVCELVISLSDRERNVDARSEGLTVQAWCWLTNFGWLGGFWRHTKFWVVVFVTMSLQLLLVFFFSRFNPFIVYSSPYLVFLCSVSLFFVSLMFAFRFLIGQDSLPEHQKHTVLIQTYTLTWLLLLFSTIAIGKASVGGFYLISVWNGGVFLACMIGYMEKIFVARETRGLGNDRIQCESSHSEEDRVVEPESDATENDETERDATERDATETMPLLGARRHRELGGHCRMGYEESGAIRWWIVQLLLVVPAPAILVAHIGVIAMDAMSQTLADGNNPVGVYLSISLVSILLVLPASPFILKVHPMVGYVFAVVFALATTYALLVFPFDMFSPLKVFFQQRIIIDSVIHPTFSASDTTSVAFPAGAGNVTVRAVTALSGTPLYLWQQVIPNLPSSMGKPPVCQASSDHPGLWTCEWDSNHLLPSPGGRAISDASITRNDWLKAAVERTGRASARITLQGRNTRACRLYFDSGELLAYQVQGAPHRVVSTGRGSSLNDGRVKVLRLWSRSWDRAFVVDLEWNAPEGMEGDVGFEGRVACEWAEYASGSVDNGSIQSAGGLIPALEEVLTFLPSWAVVTKETDGLVEVSQAFVI